MAKPRVLITGASGLLGGHLCVAAQAEGEVYGTYYANHTLAAGTHALKLDLTNRAEVLLQLGALRPAIVIHAAVQQVEACEREPEFAARVNVAASATLAEWCEDARARLVYLSSDLVFDGGKGMYRETDLPLPLMLYGQQKLAAERAVMQACSRACVVRLPLMYGFPAAGGSNFFLHMLKRLQNAERVAVFHDQYRTPGLVQNMASAVWEVARSDFSGVLHVAGTTRCSRAEMAQSICRMAGLRDSLLDSISMFAITMAAPRPQDVSLDCTQAQQILRTRLLGLEEGLASIPFI